MLTIGSNKAPLVVGYYRTKLGNGKEDVVHIRSITKNEVEYHYQHWGNRESYNTVSIGAFWGKMIPINVFKSYVKCLQ